MTNEIAASYEVIANRFIRRVSRLLSLRYFLILITYWAFALGVLVVAARAISFLDRGKLLWGLLSAVPVAAVAILLGIKRAPDSWSVRALLDRQNRCGGLLMASWADLGEWRERVPPLSTPRLRWRAGRTPVLTAVAVLFVSLSFVIPVRPLAYASDRRLDVTKQIEQIKSGIELLKNEELIEPSRSEALEAKLNSLANTSDVEDPAKTWEALDHLENSLSNTANDAAENLTKRSERLAQAQALAQALDEPNSSVDSKLRTDAMKELSAIMEGAGSADQAGERISDDLAQSLRSGSLSEKQLKQLAAALGKRGAQLGERLSKLHDAGLIDGKTLRRSQKAGQCESAGLAEFLNKNKGKMSVQEMVGAWGKGGVDRGRADAPMTWTDPSSERGTRFKEQSLPPAALEALKNSELIGRSTSAPEVAKSGSQKSGSLNSSSAGGGSALTHTVLPKHRSAVRKYFDRP